MAIEMYSFKKADAGMCFVGFDDERKIYSLDYYANVGLLNCQDCEPVKLKELKAMRAECERKGYEQVMYLKGTCYRCKYANACADWSRSKPCKGKEIV